MLLQDVTFARENLRRHAWAQEIVAGWREEAVYGMGQGRPFWEAMMPELTPWPEYGQNCPACVGRLSSMGETGLYEWDVREPDRLTCKYCKTVYPNAHHPETGAMTARRMGQTFSFYLTEEERAHPEDTSGQYAFKWSRWPVHTSWSGIIRSKKGRWCVDQMVLMAKLYAVTGEAAYAERAAWIVDLMARRYPNWLFHTYDGRYADLPPAEVAIELGRNPRGGKFPAEAITTAFPAVHHEGDATPLNNGFWGSGRFGCSGSDARTLLHVALAYDAIREALSLDEDRRVREDLLLACCADSENWDEINNKCGPARALSGAVGILFGRPQSVRRAIEGFEALLERSFHFDGFCNESPGYSNMHLNLMQEIPEVLARDLAQGPEGFDPFQKCDRYRLALESMVRMLDPNLQNPVIGDSRAGSGVSPVFAEVLAAHYGHRYAGLLERAQGAPLSEKGSEYALWHRDPDLKAASRVHLPHFSEWFPGWHVAVLRGGEGVRKQTAFYLNGYSQGGHRHYDTLGIIYIAHGKEMAADRGYIWDDPRNAWTKSTLSHNLVIVDGESQNHPDRKSRLELFGRGAGVEVVQASADAYTQCDTYQRTCVLVEIPDGQTYTADFFRVAGGGKHAYGFHCNGHLVGVTEATPEPVEETVEWLSNLRAARPTGPCVATWEYEGVRMDLRLLSPIDRLLVADAPGWRSNLGVEQHRPPVQEVLAERRGGSGLESRYAAVMSPYAGEDSPVRASRLVVDDARTGAMAIAVEREGCTDYIVSSPEGGPVTCGPLSVTGRFGFASVDAAGRLLRAYLLDGTELRCGEEVLRLPEGRTALKVASVAGRAFHLTADAPGDRDLKGTYLLAEDTGYEIEAVSGRAITVRDYPAIVCDRITLLNSRCAGGKL